MARVFNAPGVYRREIDLSEILIPTGISDGGIVIRAPKGPINRPVLISNDKEFIETFGEPVFTSGNTTVDEGVPRGTIPEFGYGAYASLEFLKQSNTLYVVRDFDENDKYAFVGIDSNREEDLTVSAIPSQVAPDFDTRERIYSIDEAVVNQPLLVGYVGPGELGNDYAVTVESLSPSADWLLSYDDLPTDPISAIWDYTNPNWRDEVKENFPIASKVVKLKVYKKPENRDWDDLFANTSDENENKIRFEPIEEFYGSLKPMVDDNNNQLFIENMINGFSRHIYVKANMNSEFDLIPSSATEDYFSDGIDGSGYFVRLNTHFCELSGGTVSINNGLNDVIGWDIFENREEVPAQILINTSWRRPVKLKVGQIVARRLDCIAVNPVGTPILTDHRQIIESEKYGYPAPSYMSLYAGYSKIYDQFNDRDVWLSNAIFAASVFARVDNIGFPWDAPAGMDRATIPVIDQRKIYNTNEIGRMYDRNINAIKWIRGTGFVIWGQKTAQLKRSALDRINVRRNLLFIENNIERALLPFVFENNNDLTRLQIFTIVDEFLASIQSAGGLTTYEVVCDESNNTPLVIDSNQLNVDIYVQPIRTAEFIQFTTVVTRTGISFSDIRLKYT